MAIYSLHHSAVGKQTQARAYTGAAHVRYVSRKKACSRLLAARMPATGAKAQAWLRNQEDADRKNARVCDKVLLALPRELDAEQRAALVRSFAEAVTEGRASWLAAFHDRGKDRQNPHCHLIVRDRDVESGKRVSGMSERGSTERLRLLWEQHANQALELAGRAERIDRRTLAAQGISRQPTIHEGLSAREMEIRARAIRSKTVEYRNGTGARSRSRRVDYRKFDKGRSRPAYNRSLRASHAEYWAALDADEIARSWEAEEAGSAEQTTPAPHPETDKRKEFQQWLSRQRPSEAAEPARQHEQRRPALVERTEPSEPPSAQPPDSKDKKKAFQEWLAKARSEPPVEQETEGENARKNDRLVERGRQRSFD